MQNYEKVFEPMLYKDSFVLAPLLMRPKSRGYLELNSRKFDDQIKIHANYFDHPMDMAVLVIKNDLPKNYTYFFSCFLLKGGRLKICSCNDSNTYNETFECYFEYL